MNLPGGREVAQVLTEDIRFVTVQCVGESYDQYYFPEWRMHIEL